MAKATADELQAHLTMKDDPELNADNVTPIKPEPLTTIDDDEKGGDSAPGEPPKRKRGRPSNAERELNDSLNKETPGSSSAGAKPGPKPGKKAGGKGSLNVEALGQQLVGIHMLVSMFTGIQEIQIAPQEGVALASGISAVCDEYGLSVDGKTGAAIQLFAAAAMVYAPRAFAINQRMNKERAEQARDVGPAPAYTYDPAQAV